MSAGTVVGVDPEVTAKARRRSFTAEYKKRILAAADKAAEAAAAAAALAAKNKS